MSWISGLRATWATLPFRTRLIYGSFLFNGSLIFALLVQGARSSDRSNKLWQQHLQETDKETQGWRCYELAKLLREQCHDDTLLLLHLQQEEAEDAAATKKGEQSSQGAARAPDGAAATAAAAEETSYGGGDRLCQRVVEGLKQCREELYKDIEAFTPPAMLPLPTIVNKPPWLKEPPWFQHLQQQQKQQ